MKPFPKLSVTFLALLWCVGIRKTAATASQTAPTIRPELLYNAIVNGNSQLFRLQTLPDGTSSSTQLTSGTGTDWLNPKLSPDGQTVLTTHYQRDTDTKTVVAFPLDSPAEITIIAGSKALPCEDPAWSPDGQRIVYKAIRQHKPYRGDIMEVDLVNHRRNVITTAAIFQGHESSVPSYSRSDGGKRIAFSCFVADDDGHEYEQIFLIDRQTKAYTQLTQGRTKHWYPAWSPLGNRLVYIQNDLSKKPDDPGALLHLLDVEQHFDAPIAIPRRHGIGAAAEFVDPAFSPNGRLAFSVRWSPGTYKIFDLDPTLTVLSALVPTETKGMFGVDYVSDQL